MSDTKIDIDDICGALGVDYNPAFSTHHYLRMVYELSLRKNYPVPSPQVVRGEGDDFRSDAVALARLVLSTDAVERALYSAQGETVRENLIEIRRLANLLAPKAPTP